jgi:hypothetical protein
VCICGVILLSLSSHYIAALVRSTSLRSHEVRHQGPLLHLHRVVGVRHFPEQLEVPLEFVVEAEDRGHVAAAVAVVGGGPDRHEVLVLEVVLVALHDELVGATDELDAVDVTELVRHFGAEDPACASGRDGPAWGR